MSTSPLRSSPSTRRRTTPGPPSTTRLRPPATSWCSSSTSPGRSAASSPTPTISIISSPSGTWRDAGPVAQADGRVGRPPSGPGSPLISSLAGARAETAAIPVASARWRGLRAPLANAPGRSGDRFQGRAGREADGVRAGGEGGAGRCAVSLSHTCSGQQPLRGPPLRSGLAQEALGRTVKVADREDRWRDLPHQDSATFRTTPPKSF